MKVFNGTVRAVDDISFSVDEGEIFGFLGPNGAGKTTTISILTTLLKQTSGEARVGGYDISQDPTEVRRILGLVPQDLTVDDDLTGKENMILQGDLYRVPREDTISRTEALLELVGLTGSADRLVKTYSGGMRKRLELAEGLIHRPRILFLDEPTLGLDVQTRAAMWDYIMNLKREHNTTIFLTTHYLEEADSLCDRIGIIDQGRIIALDTPDRLKEKVGGDVIEITIRGGEDHSDEIREIHGVLGVEASGESYRIKVTRGEDCAPSILQSLWAQEVVVKSVNIRRPSLDQVFLDYTGRSFRDENQTGARDMGQRMASAEQARRRR